MSRPAPAFGASLEKRSLTDLLNAALDAEVERSRHSATRVIVGDVWQGYHQEHPTHWQHDDDSWWKYYIPRAEVDDAVRGVPVMPIGQVVDQRTDDPNALSANLTIKRNERSPFLRPWYVARALAPSTHVLMGMDAKVRRDSRLHLRTGIKVSTDESHINRACIWTVISEREEPGWRFINKVGITTSQRIPGNLPWQSLLENAEEFDYLHHAADLRRDVRTYRKPLRLWEVVKVRGEVPEQHYDAVIVGDLAITGLQRKGALHANPSAGEALGSVIVLRLVKHRHGDGATGRQAFVPVPLLPGQRTQWSVDSTLFRTVPCRLACGSGISLDELAEQPEDAARGLSAARSGPALVAELKYLLQELFAEPPTASRPGPNSTGAGTTAQRTGTPMITKNDEDKHLRQWAREVWQEPVTEDVHQRRLQAQREDAWSFPLAMEELDRINTAMATEPPESLVKAWQRACRDEAGHRGVSLARDAIEWVVAHLSGYRSPWIMEPITASSQEKPCKQVVGDVHVTVTRHTSHVSIGVERLRGCSERLFMAVTNDQGNVVKAVALPPTVRAQVTFEKSEDLGFWPTTKPWRLTFLYDPNNHVPDE